MKRQIPSDWVSGLAINMMPKIKRSRFVDIFQNLELKGLKEKTAMWPSSQLVYLRISLGCLEASKNCLPSLAKDHLQEVSRAMGTTRLSKASDTSAVLIASFASRRRLRLAKRLSRFSLSFLDHPQIGVFLNELDIGRLLMTPMLAMRTALNRGMAYQKTRIWKLLMFLTPLVAN